MERNKLKYDFAPPDKTYVLALQLELLQKALAPWPRRSHPMLEVNCGDGRYLNLLWQCGFDLVATESDFALRRLALKREIPGLEVEAASEDMLPFDDDAFDWVITHLKADDFSGINAAIGESFRVARRGLLISFWNRSSLAALLCARGCKKTWPKPSASWWSVWKAARALRAGRVACLSTLYGPQISWSRHCAFSFINRIFPGAPFGAWSLIRLDMGSARAVTPLALRLGASKRSPEPAMEYTKKYTENGS